MAKKNILEVILNTINDVQNKNAANPREATAAPDVFDVLRDQLSKFDEKNRAKRASRGKSPNSILDLIKKEITKAQRANKKDPNVETAPREVYDRIINKVDQGPKRQATNGLKSIIEEYRLDVSRMPNEVLQQVHAQYMEERKKFEYNIAKSLHDLSKKFK